MTYSIDRFYTFTRASQFIAFFGFLLGLFYWLKDSSDLDKVLNIYFGVIILGVIINILSLVIRVSTIAVLYQGPISLSIANVDVSNTCNL